MHAEDQTESSETDEIDDPQLTLIRSSELSTEFYRKVMSEINRRGQAPSGLALHFAGLAGDDGFAVTVYRDRASMARMFNEFTSPAVTSAARETEVDIDIGRHEFPVMRLLIADAFEATRYRSVDGEMVAFFVSNAEMSAESYATVTADAHFPEQWPEGMLLHIATDFGEQWGVFDIWTDPTSARRHYDETILPLASAATGVPHIGEGEADTWMELKAIKLAVEPGDPMRDYTR